MVPGSIAAEIGLEAGDRLWQINGQAVEDLIDYRFLTAEEEVDLLIEKKDGVRILYELEKDPDEEIGCIFGASVFDGIRLCRNRCLFCFVDQLPPHARRSLRVKDDDYRMSFLQGNFITCTNLNETEIERVLRLGLSPLYISVHATDDAVRRYLLGKKNAPPVMPLLKKLTAAGIQVHAQVVLCPGINDGEILTRTVRDLSTLLPAISSLALVPVGLTAYQKNDCLRPYRKEEAAALIQSIHSWQQVFLKKWQTRFVYLADEFYLLAAEPFPAYDSYEEFAQLENGVGLTQMLWQQFYDVQKHLPAALPQKREVAIATGLSGAAVLKPIVAELNKTCNLRVELIPLKNRFFGETITVTGLLTGRCLIEGLKMWRQGKTEKPLLFISQSMLKFESDLFLDGLHIEEVANALQADVRPVAVNGEQLAYALLGL